MYHYPDNMPDYNFFQRLRYLGSALILPIVGVYCAAVIVYDNWHARKNRSHDRPSIWKAYVSEPLKAFVSILVLFVICTPFALFYVIFNPAGKSD